LKELTNSEKVVERSILMRRAFSRANLYNIGKELKIPYFWGFFSAWEMPSEDAASLEIAVEIEDAELGRIFKDHKPRQWAVFRGKHYSLKDGKLSLEGFGDVIRTGIQRARVKYGSDGISVLKTMAKSGGVADIAELRRHIRTAELPGILEDLERLNVITSSYRGDKYQEWRILEESLPIIELELGIKRKPLELPREKATLLEEREKSVDYVREEKSRAEEMELELTTYLADLLKHRLDQAIRFGKEFNVGFLSNYLQELFGPVLHFDSLLSITQQYGLSNNEIVHEEGKTGKRTGWSLALFGDPGTGKSFSTRDMILGKPDAKVGAHGLPGRNRYCGGITPARFIRIGEAYAGKVFNFIVPEFNDFFRYKGMVEPLKIAMEQGEIKYETHREIIGPYRFTSFFSVNYNVSVHERGYAVTIRDPNFNAIEDRMLCRLHRLTKERFIEITKSQMKLALGSIDIEESARRIRDHLTLVYAIETGHPLAKERFRYKPVMITPHVFDVISKARESILERIPQKVVKFSARLEDKALRFACAASLMSYFGSDLDYVPVDEYALRLATQLYVEEASVRSGEAFEPEEVLKKVLEG